MKENRGEKGIVLILTFIILVTLAIIVSIFLFMTSVQAKARGYDIDSNKALWLAEAGLQKAIWNLMHPISGAGQGEDWTTPGTTETLSDGSYIMKVERWDWALAANDSIAVASSQKLGHEADKVNDGDDATYWETVTKPLPPGYEYVVISFPYPLVINKACYAAPDYQKRPKEYKWQVSTDGVNYTTVFSNSNGTMKEINEFAAQTNVNYLRLWISKIGGGALQDGALVSTVEAIGSKITSKGTVNALNRQIEQTVAVDELSVEAYGQVDWKEIASDL